MAHSFVWAHVIILITHWVYVFKNYVMWPKKELVSYSFSDPRGEHQHQACGVSLRIKINE